MEQVKYPEDYIGDKKVADIDWRKFKEPEDDLDDPVDKPASKELIEALGVDPDELFSEDEETDDSDFKESEHPREIRN